MGNVNIRLVNQSNCIINLMLSVAAPYYSQDMIRPGETMDRSVGRVWFSINAELWKGSGSKTPMMITDLDGQTYTVIDHLAIRGTHPELLKHPVLESNLNELEKRFYKQPPFYIRSDGWYMREGRTIAVRGGPSCEYKEIVYKVGNQVLRKHFQIIDDSYGLGNLEIVDAD